MNRKSLGVLPVLIAVAITGVSLAQYRDGDRRRDDDWREFDRRGFGRGGYGRGGYRGGWRGERSAREALNDPNFPDWEVDPDFKADVFTFVRVRYSSDRGGWGNGWATDFPDSDMNFSLRLHQLTTLKVNPDPVILDLTDPRLFDYPFIYMIEPGRLWFDEYEVQALRRYLENGGFLMVDDFWGVYEWENFYNQIKRVFPNRAVEDVPLSHPIFNCVYKLKEKPQVPAINRGGWRGGRNGITYERGKYYGPNHDTDPHYRAIKDDAGRIMVFICHNTDLGDGWEREGVDEEYFEEFSVKKSYPMGINIVTYAMTH